MNIGIDIDDTIMDTFDYLMPFVAEYFNADLEELQKRNISYSTLPEAWQARELDFCKKYYIKSFRIRLLNPTHYAISAR